MRLYRARIYRILGVELLKSSMVLKRFEVRELPRTVLFYTCLKVVRTPGGNRICTDAVFFYFYFYSLLVPATFDCSLISFSPLILLLSFSFSLLPFSLSFTPTKPKIVCSCGEASHVQTTLSLHSYSRE
ncbi:hypothetical protein BDU57DRAFT_517414 [Ampelomyces quisqualis]|uniref:Transmembrane protein n=1 Tax=Ampelomyces quisqualis TaxID=50730 RepID=A0A6A5QSR4_AMPQU|nr:hypothetical protein BDU57DRAFT_517414 [Ampelomyces quisqualis]